MEEQKLFLLKHANLLIVEDDMQLLDNLYNTLIIFFKNVFKAKDGLEAQALMKKKHIDVVITDYVMQGCDGYTLCKTIRESNETIPLVIMSNYSDKDKLLNSIPLNLTQYVVKPINYNIIIDTLLKIVNKLDSNELLTYSISQEISYNKISKTLICNHEAVNLTKSELLFLELLLQHKNNLVSNDLIEYELSQDDIKSDQAIRNIIHRLRKKISKDIIVNIQGLGYMIKVES